MTKEELLKALEELPKVETINSISAMNSINIDDLMAAYDRLNKVPTYDRLLKENQELKKQLEEANKKLYLCTPEIPQNVHGKYASYVDLVNEMYELKKQLEHKTKMYSYACKLAEGMEKEGIILKVQQQKFIKYLEDEIKTLEKDILETVDDMDIYMKQVKSLIIEEIIQKYKETIGVSDDNKTTI